MDLLQACKLSVPAPSFPSDQFPFGGFEKKSPRIFHNLIKIILRHILEDFIIFIPFSRRFYHIYSLFKVPHYSILMTTDSRSIDPSGCSMIPRTIQVWTVADIFSCISRELAFHGQRSSMT
jgi:hypothetical protein